MRLRKNYDPICSYCMEIFKDFKEQLRRNATECCKNIWKFCGISQSMQMFHWQHSYWFDKRVDLKSESSKKIENFGSCKHWQDDIEYVQPNPSIEIDDEENYIPVETVEQLPQSETNRLTRSNDDVPYKSIAFMLMKAVMMKRFGTSELIENVRSRKRTRFTFEIECKISIDRIKCLFPKIISLYVYWIYIQLKTTELDCTIALLAILSKWNVI